MAHTEPKRVTLVDPNGNEFLASTPADVSTLVYGSGYRVKDPKMTVEDATALLAEKGPAADFLDPAPVQPATPNKVDSAALKGSDK